jgi:hypothetical protein
MTNEPSRRSRKAARYRPSSAEREKAAQFIEKLTPSPAAYQEYRALVDFYHELVGPLVGRQQGGVITGFRLRRSKLFGDREYLIAYADDGWLSTFAPDCDAVCSSMAARRGGPELLLQTPPLVFIPDSKRRARSNAFRSVVEHEIVHVNQAILETFPEPPTGRRAEDLLDFFLGLAIAEYEASLVQITRWTETLPTDVGVSLDHWCLLRGYSQALGQVLSIVVDLDFPATAVKRFYDTLEASLPDLLRRVGTAEDLIPWFQERLNLHLSIAVANTAGLRPAVKKHPAFLAALRWLQVRLDGLLDHQSSGDR